MGDQAIERKELIEALVDALHSDDKHHAAYAAGRIRDLVIPSSPDARANQDAIGAQEGCLEGLVNLVTYGSDEGTFAACHALAQLAWSNARNSFRIPAIPSTLDALARAMRNEGGQEAVREYACITVGNCGANSVEGAKLIARHERLMLALTSAITLPSPPVAPGGAGPGSRMRETATLALKNCAASSDEAAFIIAEQKGVLSALKVMAKDSNFPRLRNVAIGAMNTLSRSARAIARLQEVWVEQEVPFPAAIQRPSSGVPQCAASATTSLLATSPPQGVLSQHHPNVSRRCRRRGWCRRCCSRH
ncbi:armadillo-type protein [Baffinella frigidus]|nr:armadillo-type protein [Cryptophyta sp. CCMP2293]